MIKNLKNQTNIHKKWKMLNYKNIKLLINKMILIMKIIKIIFMKYKITY